MKKLLVLIAGVLLSVSSYGQLSEITPQKTFGEVKRGWYLISKITYKEAGSYTLTYWDAGYTSIDVYNSIQFNADEETMKALSNIFKTQLLAEPNTDKQFGLGDNVISIKTKKAFGTAYLMVFVSGSGKSGHFILNTKEIDKLFNIYNINN